MVDEGRQEKPMYTQKQLRKLGGDETGRCGSGAGPPKTHVQIRGEMIQRSRLLWQAIERCWSQPSCHLALYALE